MRREMTESPAMAAAPWTIAAVRTMKTLMRRAHFRRRLLRNHQDTARKLPQLQPAPYASPGASPNDEPARCLSSPQSSIFIKSYRCFLQATCHRKLCPMPSPSAAQAPDTRLKGSRWSARGGALARRHADAHTRAPHPRSAGKLPAIGKMILTPLICSQLICRTEYSR